MIWDWTTKKLEAIMQKIRIGKQKRKTTGEKITLIKESDLDEPLTQNAKFFGYSMTAQQ